jgi:cell division protein FtsZ
VETTLRGGGGAIMAIGRGEGEHRVEKAVIDALDSPLLYGSEIDSATRILFNIYTSKEHSLRVREMNDIDKFMDALNPNIDVIWGVSDDDSLGEAAKVTILATGFEDKFAPKFSLKDNDAYIENLIKQLYKPYKKSNFIQNEEDKEENTHNENKTIEIENPPLDGIEVTVTTSASTVTEEQPTINPTYDQAPPRRPSFVERAKSILNKLSELTEEPE